MEYAWKYSTRADNSAWYNPWYRRNKGGDPRVVVSTAAFYARVRGSVPGLGDLKETKIFLPHPRVKVSIVGSLRDREVAYSASDRQGSNFKSCVWRTVSSQSSHHPQEVLLAQFSLFVHKGSLKPDSFHFYRRNNNIQYSRWLWYCRLRKDEWQGSLIPTSWGRSHIEGNLIMGTSDTFLFLFTFRCFTRTMKLILN